LPVAPSSCETGGPIILRNCLESGPMMLRTGTRQRVNLGRKAGCFGFGHGGG
jgi:hypothetical protein